MLSALNQNSPKFFHLQTSQRWCVRCFLVFYGSTGGRLLIHTRAQPSPFCLFWLSSVHFHPTPPPHPSLHLCSLHLHLPHFLPISLLLKWEMAQNPARFFFFFFLWTAREDQKQGPRVWLQLLIKNRHWPVCHEVRNLSQPLCGRCRDPYEDILYCQLWNKQRKRGRGGAGVKFTPCQLHFLKLSVTYL